jgi:membrane-associated phospholipid phosphatase
MTDTTNDVPLHRRLADTGLVGVGASAVYYGTGAAVPPLSAPLVTALDAWTPFTAEAIWLYLPGYAACFAMVVAHVREARAWRAALLSFVAVGMVAVPFFLLLPVGAPRGYVDAGTLSGSLVGLLYAHDPAGNTFPSLHVANSVLCAGILRSTHRRAGIVASVLALGVATSVLLLKQHWAVDVPAGAALGALGVGLWRSLVFDGPQRTTTNSAPATAAAPKAP